MASIDPLGGEPPTASRFLFEVDGVEIGVFREVTGLQVTVAVQEFTEGGQNGYVHKLPGRMSWPHLVFRRGVTASDALFNWLEKSSGEGFAGNQSKLVKATGAVTAIDASGARLRAWNFADVFPVRWKGPDFESGSNAPLEEELEVAHHGFTSQTQPAGSG
ncbi:phage tail-like protein [Jatrophihabitans sp. GAS493]|uniref:phage tail protein n=1 Tax=Jatrophihabitans sp. GAS493 TaxID=1907575 RepID=UPI000BB93500|nr:phage tail protein [Jatrophihabitans sp. GAS493]SOD70937.1 phage tail-like protein [Jatrophihabitans sp. GAS493]